MNKQQFKKHLSNLNKVRTQVDSEIDTASTYIDRLFLDEITGKYEDLLLRTLAEISGVNEFLLFDYFYDKKCRTSKHFKQLWESRISQVAE